MTSPHTLELLSSIAAVLWAIIIVLFHGLRSDLDARTRMVSEYAVGHYGWIMQLAFFCMMASCGALAIALAGLGFVLDAALLSLCSVGFLGAGVFRTDPVTPDQMAFTRSGALHVVFSFVAILTFPIMSTAVGIQVVGTITSPAIRLVFTALSAMPWIGLLAFVAGAVGVRRRPGTPLGFLERLLIAAYTLWPIAAGLILATATP